MFKDCKPEIIVSELQSPEGPSFNREGVLHIVDWDAKDVYQIFPDGSRKVFAHTGGVPTGSKFHKNGHLFVADGDLGILDISLKGEICVAASEWNGEKFKGPNDLVFASNGDLYFTDPKGSDPEHPIGNVFVMRSNGKLELFAGGFQFPNGIEFSKDGKFLYLAETYTNKVLVFELDDNGLEKSRRDFIQLEGGLGPDGMAFGKDGNLYVAHFGKGVVAVINSDGQLISEIALGAPNPTNVAFWGTDLYVTEDSKGQVFKLQLGIEGQILFGLS